MNLKVIILTPDASAAVSGALFWRPLGTGEFQKIPLTHVARAVYGVALPPAPAGTMGLEYYVEAAAGAQTLRFPVTAPAINQTVVLSAP